MTQDTTESAAPEPIDELLYQHEPLPGTRSLSSAALLEQGRQSAAGALRAFPQVVHLLADPELHFGDSLAARTGLPLVNLEETPVDELGARLAQPEFADGFILEGFPEDRAEALALDSLLGATGAHEHRVLSFDQPTTEKQEIVDHYIDKGLMWLIPGGAESDPGKTQSDMMECLAGLPVLLA